MNFTYWNYLPLIFLLAAAFVGLHFFMERRFFNLIKRYWFFNRSILNTMASFFYYCGFVLLILAMLDLRGPHEKIESTIPDQKTIIAIDVSTSMLAEDVRPNRLKKALTMARHFVKKSLGHQISIVILSDFQKRVVPFTDDLDLLDSRLKSLEKLKIDSGGSNILGALNEIIQYFKMDLVGGGLLGGNILFFSDFEDQYLESGSKNYFKGINMAAVGVGTIEGGAIPIFDSIGIFRGHKRYKGKKVHTKLSMNLIDKIKDSFGNYRSWTVSSDLFSTEEILDYFNKTFTKKLSKRQIKVRKVLAPLLVIPGLLLIMMGLIMKMGASLTVKIAVVLILNLVLLFYPNSYGNLVSVKDKKIKKYLSLYQEGKLSKKEKLKLATSLLINGAYQKSLIIFEENINNFLGVEDSLLYNYATAYLMSGDIKSAAKIYSYLFNKSRLEDDDKKEKMINDIKSNILLALNKKKDKRKEKKKEKDRKEDKKEQKKEESASKEGGQDKKGKKSESKSKPQKKQKERKKKKDPRKKIKRYSNLSNKQKDIDRRRKMLKIPAILKQILNDDGLMQKKYINLGLKEKETKKSKKDW